jgi:hypothetical protein
MAMPLAREVVKDLAVEHGACIRPIQLRRTNLDTGETDTVPRPLRGHTLAHVCPSCAERAQGPARGAVPGSWHLEDEPAITPDRATDNQKFWIETRAEGQVLRDQAANAGAGHHRPGRASDRADEEITNAGMRGKAASAKPARRHRSTPPPPGRPGPAPPQGQRPARSARTYTAPGRQDLPPLPVRQR